MIEKLINLTFYFSILKSNQSVKYIWKIIFTMPFLDFLLMENLAVIK